MNRLISMISIRGQGQKMQHGFLILCLTWFIVGLVRTFKLITTDIVLPGIKMRADGQDPDIVFTIKLYRF